MTFVALNDVIDLFFRVFGNGQIMVLFLIVFFVILLFLMKANIAAILIVIVPLVFALAFNQVTTNLIDIQPWVYYALVAVLGLIFAFVIIINALR